MRTFAAGGLLVLAVALLPLAASVLIEVVVAIPFRIGRRGLKAVALVNLVTNPSMNFIVFALYGLGVGSRIGDVPSVFTVVHTGTYYWVIGGLELAVVLIEWALLRWALPASAGKWKLLALATIMNAASFLIGVSTFGFGLA
jgi:hypothetical protein